MVPRHSDANQTAKKKKHGKKKKTVDLKKEMG